MKKCFTALLMAGLLFLSAPCAAAAETLSCDEISAQTHLETSAKPNEAADRQAVIDLLENAAFQKAVSAWAADNLSGSTGSALCESIVYDLLYESEKADHAEAAGTIQRAVIERLLETSEQIDLDMPLAEMDRAQCELILSALESDIDLSKIAIDIGGLMQFSESEITLSELIFRMCAVRPAVSAAAEMPPLFEDLAANTQNSFLQAAFQKVSGACKNLSSIDIFLASIEENWTESQTFDQIFEPIHAELSEDLIADSAFKSAYTLQLLREFENDLSPLFHSRREEYLENGGQAAALQFNQVFGLMQALQAKSMDCFEACSSLGASDPPAVTEISLGLDRVLLQPGDSFVLTVLARPEGAEIDLAWSSSNEAVITVENGTVTAHTAGTAVISAAAENGAAASCDVIVQDTPAVIYSAVLHQENGAGELNCRILGSPASQTNTVNIIAAFYRGGRLLTCWMQTDTLSADNMVTLHGELPDYDAIRVFLIENGTLKPLCAAAIL